MAVEYAARIVRILGVTSKCIEPIVVQEDTCHEKA
jgi:hypothetical protein